MDLGRAHITTLDDAYSDIDDPDAVDAAYERLVALGYDGHKAPWDAPWGQRYALVRDPDGNSVDLFAPL